MIPPALPLTSLAARRFHRRAVLLDEPAKDIQHVLEYLGYVQIDPINVCGRMHDLILRNRLRAYREGDLMRHLHGTADESPTTPAPTPRLRTAFEHHLPNANILVAFPLDAWPHLVAAMQRRARTPGPWSGRLTPRERLLAEHILAEIAQRGPLSSEDIADERRARRVWGAATLAKSTLQKLFFHGRVLISHRSGNRRVYDLPERILSHATLSAPLPSTEETARWLVQLKLRQRRLALLKRDELPLVADLVQPIKVEGCPMLHCLRSDLPLLEASLAEAQSLKPEDRSPREALLLAPLDPLIYDRRATRTLWEFDYTWEVYTPAHRRTRGYYALPILAGDQIVGHIDPKADRANGKLLVVSKSVRRGYAVAPALKSLGNFLGLGSSASPVQQTGPRALKKAHAKPI